MSVVFQSDGVKTGSINSGSIILPNPHMAGNPHIIRQNAMLKESDAGVKSSHKKSKVQRPLILRWLGMSAGTYESLLEWFEKNDYSSHWFTMQDIWIPEIAKGLPVTADPTQQSPINQNIWIDLGSVIGGSTQWLFGPITYWCYIITGTQAGKRRRITDKTGQILTIEDVGGNVLVGDAVRLGIPVLLDPDSDIRAMPRAPRLLDVELRFLEKGD